MQSLAKICLVLGCAIGINANLFCYNDMKAECSSNQFSPVCSTEYGNFPVVASKFQIYANTHLARSMQALMIAKHFANYQFNRKGFHNFFLDFSNTLFDQGVGLIRYINNRGATHNFTNFICHDETNGNYEPYELQSLAWALDIEKHLAQDAIDLDKLVGGSDVRYHDADASYYLASKYAYRHRTNVRNFAAYYVELEKMETSKNQMLVLYEFDGYMDCISED